MKLFRMLGRSIRDAIKSVVRNFSLSLASISCITITLIIVAVAIMASYNVQNFTKEIERDMTIVAFLDNDDVLDAKIHSAGTISCNSLNVSCFTFITSSAASTIKSASVQIVLTPVVILPKILSASSCDIFPLETILSKDFLILFFPFVSTFVNTCKYHKYKRLYLHIIKNRKDEKYKNYTFNN